MECDGFVLYAGSSEFGWDRGRGSFGYFEKHGIRPFRGVMRVNHCDRLMPSQEPPGSIRESSW